MNWAKRVAGVVGGLVLAATSLGQEAAVWTVVPQNRTQVIMPHPDPRRPVTHQALSVKSVVASARIDDQTASTTIEMTITNPNRVVQEAQVLVPVPEGAAVRSFELDGVGGSEPSAKILRREEARRIYDAIVNASRDPGLLEFVGFNLMKSSVFPVPAGGEQKVRLTYENLLGADTTKAGTRIDYVLPRTESLQASGAEWSFNATINARRAIASVYSPSHEITTERNGKGSVKVKTVKSAGAAGSLRLSVLLEPEKSDGVAATVLMYPDPAVGSGGGYFLMLGGFPPSDGKRDAEILREVTIVLDRSGSMRGEKIEQAREGALQVLEGLKEGEYFNIIDYSDSIASFADKPVKKDKQAMEKARGYLKDIQANGGTNIHDALIEALRSTPAEGVLPVVLFLTDGLPTVGKTSEKEIRDAAEKANVHQRRIFSFGVGLDVNSPLLARIADVTRGSPTFVLPQEDVEVKVSQVFRRLSGPIFASPGLTEKKDDDGPNRAVKELLPRRLPDVFDGEQLVVLGQYTASKPVTVLLSGNYLGKDRTFEVTIDPSAASTRNAHVPRLWATRMVAELVDQIRQSAADGANAATDPKTKELVDEIVRLSTTWGILTEYTAFLVQEAPGTVTMLREMALDGAPPPMAPAAEAPAQVRGRMESRTAARSGQAAVNQELNVYASKAAAQAPGAGGKQVWYDENLKRVEANGVQQVKDRTFLWRNQRWVDAKLLEQEQAKPDLVVEFGSEEYTKLVDELAKEELAGVMAMIGDVYLLKDGRKVLIKMPS
jgi:Ca-activated chloride channel homolog